MAATVAASINAFPAAERASCAILAGNYGEAGAIDYYGPDSACPKLSAGTTAISTGGRAVFRRCVILFGERATEYTSFFGTCEQVATITNPHAMGVEQNVPVYLCRKSARLSPLWPHFKMII